MGHMVAVLEHTPIPTLSPYFATSSSLHFIKFFQKILMCLFVYILMAFGYFKFFNLPPPASTLILTFQFCVFSIPL